MISGPKHHHHPPVQCVEVGQLYGSLGHLTPAECARPQLENRSQEAQTF